MPLTSPAHTASDTPASSPDPCVVVIFGASGDLAHRKLIPALYELEAQGRLPKGLCVLGVSRTEMTDEAWRDTLTPHAKKHAVGFDDAKWAAFSQKLHYLAASATEADAYGPMTRRISELAAKHKTFGSDPSVSRHPGGLPNILFYLSVAPQLYGPIVERLGQSGLVMEGKRWCAIEPGAMPWQRIIVEKPFGTDLASAEELNRVLGRVFEEDSIYRIDHYLGKELVQNILVMRFVNTIFEPLWNNQYVDHVQVTAAETVGVGKRAGNFYDTAGALRDMIQSHLLQVAALVAMEPPSIYSPDAIRREKIKIISSAREAPVERAHEFAVLGRYGPSNKPDDEDGGLPYEKLEGVRPERRTETFAAMKLHFDNWRWSGVPFYVRSGKKMARKLTEVVVQFKHPPVNLLRKVEGYEGLGCGARPANRIVINIAPEDGISLRFEAKVPGPNLLIDSVKMDMDYATTFKSKAIEAYGPLMLDAMRGDQTLFKHKDEVETGWRICQPILDSAKVRNSIETYAPGTWGPESSDELLGRDGRVWHNPRQGETR
ncbi:MAG TPA: glucose-6-phosphate dehydrogenase [Phycisphaerales bacterium]|nr:glucose-6-phosphate dehydrogenase [Phycisphaerales bacterium]